MICTRTALAAVLFVAASAAAQAGDIIADWANVKAPAALELKPVSVDPKTTALLLLDFQSPNCTNRPRCMASLPAMKKLLTDARAKGMPVVYSLAGQATAANIMPDLAPTGGERW